MMMMMTKKPKSKKKVTSVPHGGIPSHLQCSSCGKWRSLPLQNYNDYVRDGINISDEKYNWTCSMNTWNEYNNCLGAVEEGCDD